MKVALKILHIGNGNAYKIKAIVDALLERGHEIHMVPIPPATPAEGPWDGVKWIELPDPPILGPAKVLARFAQVRRLVKHLRPDIVHAHNAWGPGWYGAATGRHPLVMHAYGGDLLPEQYRGRPGFQRWLTAWSCRAADRIIVTGQHMISASAVLGIPPERLMLLPRGVDLQRYRPGLDTRTLRRSLGLGETAPVIFSPRYQVDESLYCLDIVIEAFSAVRHEIPDAVCLQMFDPKRETGRVRLAEAAAARGLGESYRLVPSVDNAAMPLFYNLAEVVVSVPSTDGFPVTVLEASACGAALVVSRLPYCSEWFVDGVNGVLVPVRDPNALSAAIVTLCRNSEVRQRMGAAGRTLVAERADYRRCMDELETEYRNLIGSTRRAAARET